MISHYGAQLAGRPRLSSSAPANKFFSLFYQWSRVSCSGSSRTSSSLQVRPRRNSMRSAILPPCRRSIFFLWHPKSPVTEEIHDEQPTNFLPEKDVPTNIPTSSPVSQPADTSPTSPQLSNVSQAVRQLMRHLQAPIVVLTTSHSIDGERQYHGMTLSSFTTLSLSPDPIVSFNIRTNDSEPSRTLSALESSQQFLIHILDDSPEGVIIADMFTKGINPFAGEGERGIGDILEEETLDGIILPRLSGRGVRKVLMCEVLSSGVLMQRQDGEAPETTGMGFIRVRDHVLVIARVIQILGHDSTEPISSGLSYMDGKYRRAGGIILLNPIDRTNS